MIKKGDKVCVNFGSNGYVLGEVKEVIKYSKKLSYYDIITTNGVDEVLLTSIPRQVLVLL